MGSPGQDRRRPADNVISCNPEYGFCRYRKCNYNNQHRERFHRLPWNDAVINLHNRQGHEQRKKINED
jgi:hypothetical protein